MNIKRGMLDYLTNVPGWRTKRKLLVIQSDDWGSIRMPSKKVRDILAKHPMISVDDPYNKYDTLASPSDLNALFEVLTSVQDINGRHAVVTANCIMSNPNFEEIKLSNFENYKYETLEQTFKNYGNEKALEIWFQGRDAKIFSPQFHGREHVNVPFWLENLKKGHPGIRLAFDCGAFGPNFRNLSQDQWNLQRAWDILTLNGLEFSIKSLEEGTRLFKNFFGFDSLTAVAPNYTWSPLQESILAKNGVLAMQGMLKQRIPIGFEKPYKYRYRFTKLVNISSGISYQRRNVFFEPSLKVGKDFQGIALNRISKAFQLGKPAIIGSHRVNYVGMYNEQLRNSNLNSLGSILKKVISKWPDIEFIDAAELSIIMKNNN